MLFNYKAVTNIGEKKEGKIDAATKDLAIGVLQRKGLIVVSVLEEGEHKSIFKISFGDKVPMKEVVILSRQIATLFEAQVSALKAFTLLAGNTENVKLANTLTRITDDLQSGLSIADSLAKYPDIFSDFYVNMVRAGEETGKLMDVFTYLADYLDRQYRLTTKTKNALIYPAFVVSIFILVMSLMFVFIIPKLSDIIKESGQEIPFYTKIVMWMSDMLLHYGIFILLGIIIGVIYLYKLTRTDNGKTYLDKMKISIPIFKTVFRKLYLSRMADNLDTMLSSGIPIIRAIDITSAVVGNSVYQNILKETSEAVKAGSLLSDALAKHPEIPQMMSQMIKVGEETGALGKILKTVGRFYSREAEEAVDTLVTLIEPLMIVVLGLGVGTLLASVLMPIYNIAGGIH
ncbi:type II secretion system F family protein [Candidatus Nomurabacteria bacterium]|nr:type II secretion system F family protein [Candidatus Nomurabacteria bacterium]